MPPGAVKPEFIQRLQDVEIVEGSAAKFDVRVKGMTSFIQVAHSIGRICLLLALFVRYHPLPQWPKDPNVNGEFTKGCLCVVRLSGDCRSPFKSGSFPLGLPLFSAKEKAWRV